MKASIEEYAATRRVAFGWSVLAAAAVVFSFLCTLTLALACLALPLLMWKLVLHGFSFAAAIVLLPLFGVVAGLSILWALVPRAQRFEPSGVRLDLLQQKRLASELALVAGALHEPVPQEVYLIADARAYVTERKRTWRTGRQKALALGLPLIGTLSVAEFRALLAHEFAHFYCGDTRLLPWVNRGRNMMIRVYTHLSPEASLMGFLAHFILLAVPYALLMRGIRFYWIRFMGLANFISRRQELRSDEIAARLAGVPQVRRCTFRSGVNRPRLCFHYSRKRRSPRFQTWPGTQNSLPTGLRCLPARWSATGSAMNSQPRFSPSPSPWPWSTRAGIFTWSLLPLFCSMNR